jgi:hypothetical protein
MKTIPVDTSKLTMLVGGAILPATSPDGSPRRDRSGQTLFNIPVVVVVEGGNADTLTVRVPGPVPQVAPLTPVKFVALVARPWSMDGGRSGVSFSAESIQPAAVRS